MVAIFTTPEDIVNDALVRIGSKHRIGSIYEGTDAAKAALDIYGQTRDAVLREFDWGFAEKIAPAVVSPGTAPPPWSVSLVYPADCVRIRSLLTTAYLADQTNPLPVLYTIASGVTGRVVLCNDTGVSFVYTTQVAAIAQWEPLAIEAFCAALARRLAPVLIEKVDPKALMEDEKGALTSAESILG